MTVPDSLRSEVQTVFSCCGLYDRNNTYESTPGPLGHPACSINVSL
jgi:hypothetical protein